MNREFYLLIADTITAVKNDFESEGIDIVVEALAEAFKDYDPEFDRVQFLNDCEIVEANV